MRKRRKEKAEKERERQREDTERGVGGERRGVENEEEVTVHPG